MNGLSYLVTPTGVTADFHLFFISSGLLLTSDFHHLDAKQTNKIV